MCIDAVEVRKVVQITKNGIDALDKALGLYNRQLDHNVPWKMYEETLDELDRHLADYSNDSGHLVGEVKTLIRHAHDSYRSASQNVYDFCGPVKMLLANYLQLFEKPTRDTYEELRAIFIQVLDHGMTKMTAGQVMLERCSMNFKNVAGKVTTLRRQLNIEFDCKSSFFQAKINQMHVIRGAFGLAFPFSIPEDVEAKLLPELQQKMADVLSFFDELKGTIDATNVEIDAAKSGLQDEVKNIGDVKAQKENRTVVPMATGLEALLGGILAPVNSLIAQCHEYEKRHDKENS